MGTQAIPLWCEAEALDIVFSMGINPPTILRTNRSSNTTIYALSSVLDLRVPGLWSAERFSAVVAMVGGGVQYVKLYSACDWNRRPGSTRFVLVCGCWGSRGARYCKRRETC